VGLGNLMVEPRVLARDINIQYLHIHYTFSFIIRKKFKVLTKGTRVQKYLDYLAGCTLRWAQKSDPLINEGGDGYVDLSEYAREGPGAGVNGELHTDSLGNTLVEYYPELGSNKGSAPLDPYPDPVHLHSITNPVY